MTPPMGPMPHRASVPWHLSVIPSPPAFPWYFSRHWVNIRPSLLFFLHPVSRPHGRRKQRDNWQAGKWKGGTESGP